VELGAAEHEVMGDPRRLQQVFWNLLKNASKFTPANGTIRIASHSNGQRVTVEVHDTGVGFEPADNERIFTAFEQASESVSRQFGGLGLGLAIVKATLDAHGGSIRASSTGKDQGATFSLSLALATKETTDD
jgi:signal transduction histidine kinase